MEGQDRFGFIINSEPNTKYGKHWMACYVDVEGDKSIGFFDPFGEKMDPQIREDLKEFVEKKGVLRFAFYSFTCPQHVE